jgi:hypothetical protein
MKPKTKPKTKPTPPTAAEKRREKEYRAKLKALLWVEVCEAKPNPMFSEWQRSTVRFLRFNGCVPCAECGKKRRLHWTMLCAFRCKDMKQGVFSPVKSAKVHAPLSPVCSEHLLGPAT